MTLNPVNEYSRKSDNSGHKIRGKQPRGAQGDDLEGEIFVILIKEVFGSLTQDCKNARTG